MRSVYVVYSSNFLDGPILGVYSELDDAKYSVYKKGLVWVAAGAGRWRMQHTDTKALYIAKVPVRAPIDAPRTGGPSGGTPGASRGTHLSVAA